MDNITCVVAQHMRQEELEERPSESKTSWFQLRASLNKRPGGHRCSLTFLFADGMLWCSCWYEVPAHHGCLAASHVQVLIWRRGRLEWETWLLESTLSAISAFVTFNLIHSAYRICIIQIGSVLLWRSNLVVSLKRLSLCKDYNLDVAWLSDFFLTGCRLICEILYPSSSVLKKIAQLPAEMNVINPKKRSDII